MEYVVGKNALRAFFPTTYSIHCPAQSRRGEGGAAFIARRSRVGEKEAPLSLPGAAASGRRVTHGPDARMRRCKSGELS